MPLVSNMPTSVLAAAPVHPVANSVSSGELWGEPPDVPAADPSEEERACSNDCWVVHQGARRSHLPNAATPQRGKVSAKARPKGKATGLVTQFSGGSRTARAALNRDVGGEIDSQFSG